jgi:hypothetical protein
MQGYRTYIIAALQVGFGLLAQTNWTDMFANPKAGLVALGSGILMAIMRSITTTPPGASTPAA